MIYEVNDFQTQVLDRSGQVPVVVDFWAEWCQPCKMLQPILEGLALKSEERWVLAKVNTDIHKEVAARYRISSIPNVKLFVKGEVVSEFKGALPERQVLAWLNKFVPGKHHDQLLQVRNLLQQGMNVEARELLNGILASEPGNQEAKVLMAHSQVFSDPQAAVDALKGITSDSMHYDTADSLKTLAELLTLNPDGSELPESPVKNDFLSGVRSIQQGDFDQALGGFIRAMQEDGNYHQESARKACIALFKYLGEQHEITRKHRRRFSSILYA